MTPGNYYLLFLTDNSHSQAEANENNNVRAVAVTVTPANLDLVVTGATGPASSPLGPIDVPGRSRTRGRTRPEATGRITSTSPRTMRYDAHDSLRGSSFVSASPVIDGGRAIPGSLRP